MEEELGFPRRLDLARSPPRASSRRPPQACSGAGAWSKKFRQFQEELARLDGRSVDSLHQDDGGAVADELDRSGQEWREVVGRRSEGSAYGADFGSSRGPEPGPGRGGRKRQGRQWGGDIVPAEGILLALSGLALAGTMVTLTLSTPVFLSCSRVLLPGGWPAG